MIISNRFWTRYIGLLRSINDKAADEMKAFLAARNWRADNVAKQACIDFGYALSSKYGAAAGTVACQMYDALARQASVSVPSALPAETATYDEVARSVVGTMKTNNDDVVAGSVGRLVKMAGVDTTMQNAIRDGAEWAWVPRGDTCAFCITLASRGWQKASVAQLKGGHAEHIHANCDCTYAIRFNPNTNVAGYNPDQYLDMYMDQPGRSSKAKINAMRRQFYADNRKKITAQKRDAYAKRKELNSSSAEETNID